VSVLVEEDRVTLRQLVHALGFRRIEHVHIEVGAGYTTAEMIGTAHRYPRTVRIPLRTAARLVAAGAPLRVTGVGRVSVGAV
jgi:hypothetical protein